ncbi:hemin uptake protein HemP [uncultured Tateyamaria sp.]|uniref:hemin uptake protein HemP n=1 Tax=uncultured Tateyamaria sp. TaxID=455651 RepID=UPI00261C1D66|nr:hemin uptake protein HemP [uncultured Tateyamaria sp.]
MTYQPAPETLKPAPNTLPTYAAEDLTKGADQAQIVLGNQTYLLRITRAGKLILTK